MQSHHSPRQDKFYLLKRFVRTRHSQRAALHPANSIFKTQNGTGDVDTPSIIGLGGWQAMKFLFDGGGGIIYAVPS